MKLFLSFLFIVFTSVLYAQTTFYSNGTSTNFNTLSGWSVNADGTGANPTVFNNTITLIVQNAHSKNTSGIVTLNRLTIQSGGIVTANNAITVTGTTPQFNINNGGTYIHNNTGTLNSTIFAGTESFGGCGVFELHGARG